MGYERENNGIRLNIFIWVHIHTPPPFKRCRREMLIASLCAFHAEDSFCEENRIGAIHIF